METGILNNSKSETDSQEPEDLNHPKTSGSEKAIKLSVTSRKMVTPKGVEIAKKRLRAFSIQKKSSLSPLSVHKPVATGSATVFIGKLAGAKPVFKPEPDPAAELKKPPKPPKPGANRLLQAESHMSFQKKTLDEIEDMKRKMELVELGIPLGLICPTPNSDKAMPTKAMPPIKSFIAPAKVDELIREAKKARAEGKEFKFDYRKLLPDYDNPFQRKKDEYPEASRDDHEKKRTVQTSTEKEKRISKDKYDSKKHSLHIKDEKYKYRDDRYYTKDDKSRDVRKSRYSDPRHKNWDIKTAEREYKSKDNYKAKKDDKKSLEKELHKYIELDDQEADVDLKDFLVCDSWSENEEKSKESTPKTEDKKKPDNQPTHDVKNVDPLEHLRATLNIKEKALDSPRLKIEKLKPVVDTFKYEIEDNNEDEILDIFDENLPTETFAKTTKERDKQFYDSPLPLRLFDTDSRDDTIDDMTDDTFLESVINEIKQEELDDTSQDKGLVEYDESPVKDDDDIRESVTPELNDRVREMHSSRSDYSDGNKSTDSGCKSTESGYRSTESLKLSKGIKSDNEMEPVGAKYSGNLLDTWSFVLKICQPLLFRHDKNKCYRETSVRPNLWYSENPKFCSCVKDRRIVYKELEMCKMDLVDNIYNSKQQHDLAYPTARGWYPGADQCLTESSSVQLSSEWEAEDSQTDMPATPEKSGEMSLDQEYQKFMKAVWPEVADDMSETPRSSPVRDLKKKVEDQDKGEKNPKKLKMSSDGWSQESEIEDVVDKSTSKKLKVEKPKRKRKRSSTSVTDSSESDPKKKKKMQKKKDNKKLKSKDAKRRRLIKKNIKKLKNKQKKKKKIIKLDEESETQDFEIEKKKKEKKLKKKKLQKQKKKTQKKKKTKESSSSSSSSSSSDSSSEEVERESKRNKTGKKKKNRKKSSSESDNTELFDVNILNNIKTERLTDDEKVNMEFSPRRQKPREIINVKELQNDFVGNSIQIKKEIEETRPVVEETRPVVVDSRPVVEETRKEEIVEKSPISSTDNAVEEKEQHELENTKEQEETCRLIPQIRTEESNLSQCSSQESIYSVKEQPPYEKDESHLRPSSQNSNYSFHDLMVSGKFNKNLELEKVPQDTSRNDSQDGMRPQEVQREMTGHNSKEFKEPAISQHGIQEHILPGHVREEHEMDQHRVIEYDVPRHDLKDHEMAHHEVKYEEIPHHSIKVHEIPFPEIKDYNVRHHEIEDHVMPRHDINRHEIDLNQEDYGHGDYEMYEQMAMAYQSDVASQTAWSASTSRGDDSRPIETVVHARSCGEIKCDWRAGDSVAERPRRPSRWGLKPGEVNIVLTGGGESYRPRAPQPVYQIQSIANRTDNSAPSYDEAYMDTYGASDRLQYGDCFSTNSGSSGVEVLNSSTPILGSQSRVRSPGASGDPRRKRYKASLDDRINLALKTTVLGEVAGNTEEDDKDVPDKGILVTKSLAVTEGRGVKRVSFADGYKPGQDSDVEEPPIKKKKKSRRIGCAWPCPATHEDHVPLWDALPPPPPPPGSPPPPREPPPPPPHLLRAPPPTALLQPPPHLMHKLDANGMPVFMPPEPPPGLLSF